MRIIIVTSKTHGINEIYVDDEDYAALSKHRWYVWKSSTSRTLYALTNSKLDGKRISLRMHGLILPSTPGLVVNHKDHNGLNNTRANLELISVRANHEDMQSRLGCSSKYRGVYIEGKTAKWRGSIKTTNKHGVRRYISLGYFGSEEEAALAWNKAADALGFHGYRNKIPNKG